jgi:hypothetical protein
MCEGLAYGVNNGFSEVFVALWFAALQLRFYDWFRSSAHQPNNVGIAAEKEQKCNYQLRQLAVKSLERGIKCQMPHRLCGFSHRLRSLW